MGGKRGAGWFFLLMTLILVVVIFAGCICGLNSLAPQNIGNDDYNVSSSGPKNRESIGSPVLGAQDTHEPTITPTPAPTPRPSAFTIYAEGGKDHRHGETLRFYGMDTCSDVVYLFISGTNAPICGGCLENIRTPVIDSDPATFTRVNVSEDGSWEYFWTAPAGKPALLFDLYNVIVAAEPRDKPHLDEALAWDLVTVKIS
jgi:hypothetical protein